MATKVTGYEGEEFGRVQGVKKKEVDKLRKRAGSFDHEGTVKTGKVTSIVQTFGALKKSGRKNPHG